MRNPKHEEWSVSKDETAVSLVPFDYMTELNRMWSAAKTCYSPSKTEDIFWEQYDKPVPEEEKIRLIKDTLAAGHTSVTEHVHFTFMISGVSRALTHQLVRHRLMNVSQQSQRYVSFDKISVKDGDNSFVIPPSVISDADALDIYIDAVNYSFAAYRRLKKRNIPSEDARMVIGSGAKSNIVITVNIPELMHICNERMCSAAQWEIRRLLNLCAKLVTGKMPFLKEYLVPKCEKTGYCPEKKKRSCGRKITKEELFSK